jgi:AmmeMemoRadiSam system protein B
VKLGFLEIILSVRNPAVAGYFYPNDQNRLRTEIAALLAEAKAMAKTASIEDKPALKALIVPHAGIEYSGLVAACAYHLLSLASDKIKRVVIFGPAHRLALSGCALADHDYFQTPLGEVELDKKLPRILQTSEFVRVNNEAHRQEHSIEVQLPFLQQVLGHFTLLPVVVGHISKAQFASVLAKLELADDLLVVISSDLSHFHEASEARMLDNLTIKQLLGNTAIEPLQACGSNILNGFMPFAQSVHWQPNLLYYANSGDVGGDQSKVVGYASFACY